MQPVTISLPGKFWDSQIYRNRMYLFMRDGSISTINWGKLVEELPIDVNLRLPLTCAFQRSDYLYKKDWLLFFSDLEIKSILQRKFEQLSEKRLHLNQKTVQNYLVKQQDNPFSFPNSDSIIYRNEMYVSNSDGIYKAVCSSRNINPVSTRVVKQWDAPAFSIAASYKALAIGAGKDGLWEKSLSHDYLDEDDDLTQLSADECDSCEFMYHSVYGTSYYKGGFLAEFSKSDSSEPYRRFDKIVPASKIFRSPGYSWGTRDKIYSIDGNLVQIARYNPFSKKAASEIEYISEVHIDSWKGNFVSAGSAPFGAILEYDNALVVLPSKGRPFTIRGEPVNWRVFPNSVFYQNQLHVIFDDELVIYSFNQDYFVAQEEKIFGLRPYRSPFARAA